MLRGDLMVSHSYFDSSMTILYALIDNNNQIIHYNRLFGQIFNISENDDRSIDKVLLKKKVPFEGKLDKYKLNLVGMTVTLDFVDENETKYIIGEVQMMDENDVFNALTEQNNEMQNLYRELTKKNKEIENVLKELNLSKLKLIQEGRLVGLLRIAAGIAHEINNPLSIVSSNIKYLEGEISGLKEIQKIEFYEDESDGITQIEFDELIEEIYDGLGRIKEIVESFRLYTNVDSYEKKYECDLLTSIKTVINNIPSNLTDDIEIEIEVSDTINLFLDASYFNDAITHLLMNAIESFSNQEDKKIHISLKDSIDDIILVIQDNGDGIKEDDLQFVFDPFFTTKIVGAGEGIGLSICYDFFVNVLFGRISIDSRLYEGTKVIIHLPKGENLDE